MSLASIPRRRTRAARAVASAYPTWVQTSAASENQKRIFATSIAPSLERVLVCAKRVVAEPLPREVLGDPGPAGLPEAPPQVGIAEQPLKRRPQRIHVPRRHQQPRLLVHDEVTQAADVPGDNRPTVRHRLRADDAEALTA